MQVHMMQIILKDFQFLVKMVIDYMKSLFYSSANWLIHYQIDHKRKKNINYVKFVIKIIGEINILKGKRKYG
jgi:hypothetical protein